MRTDAKLLPSACFELCELAGDRISECLQQHAESPSEQNSSFIHKITLRSEKNPILEADRILWNHRMRSRSPNLTHSFPQSLSIYRFD
ncbi:hypothetical protein [Nostoc sp.]|uniref:hypothetical protein n=1 Tax=Nostoc sp. TaxID=1180 RepID=UPI002FFAE670